MLPTEKHIENFNLDKFGYTELSKNILENILLKMELPNCFGLYGNWGSGKSTIIHFIQKHISDNYKNTISICFDAWKYEYSDQKDLVFALLNAIEKKLGKHKEWAKIKKNSLAISFGLARFIGIDIQDSMQDLKNLEKIIEAPQYWVDEIEEFKKNFNKIVKQLLKRKDRLIIFIDDLDRCLPENSVKLLEGIKNFLTVENVLFVLAIDRRVMSEMIEKKYDLYHGYGHEYLTKIIHYYYELPQNDQNQIVQEILKYHDIKFSEKQKDYIVNFLKTFASETRLSKHILHQFAINIILSNKIKNIIEKDSTEKELQYLFVANFLLIKFPKIFYNGESRESLRSLSEITSCKIRNDHARYQATISKNDSINPTDRKILEDILIKKIEDQEDLINYNKLSVALSIIKESFRF